MQSKVCLRRRTQTAVFMASLVFSGVAIAQQNCKSISGTVSPLTPLTTCPAGYSACFQGQFTGDIAGSFTSGLTKLEFISESSVRFEARTLITTGNHTISTFDSGIGVGCGVVSGPVICASSTETLGITSGTGAYTQAYGTVTLLDVGFTHGGTYQGQLCHGRPSQQRQSR